MSHAKKIIRVFVATAFVAAGISTATAADEGRRLALIVGNDAYSVRPLQNAVNDARAMDKALQGAGFRTILVENATKVALESGVAKFLASIGPEDTALFFYAGHAIQIENENVLIPVDFEAARSPIEAKFRSFSLARVFDELRRTRVKRAILIVDACRSNPVAESYSLVAGLAMPQNAGREWYIAYSTSPNHVATDNPNGKNSYFTEALSDLISQPALTIDDVFTRVRDKVTTATRGAQTPWSQTSMTAKFYFNPPKNAEVVAETGLTKKWLDEALANEQRGEWQEAIDLFDRVLKEEKTGSLHDRAAEQVPYATLRRDAEKDFEQGQYESAAKKQEEAFQLQPFNFTSAIEAVNGYLLTENLDGATALLKRIRQRASSAQVATADAMLKEIAVVNTAAAAELKQGVPAPPPIKELFATHRPGVPDFSAGQQHLRQAQGVDLAKLAAQFPPPAPPTPSAPASATPGTAAPGAVQAAAPTAAADAQPPVDLASFHLEIHSLAAGRDLVTEEFGEVQIGSEQASTAVLLDGNPITRALPYTRKLPPGKYRVTFVEGGKKLSEKEIEVKSGSMLMLSAK